MYIEIADVNTTTLGEDLSVIDLSKLLYVSCRDGAKYKKRDDSTGKVFEVYYLTLSFADGDKSDYELTFLSRAARTAAYNKIKKALGLETADASLVDDPQAQAEDWAAKYLGGERRP